MEKIFEMLTVNEIILDVIASIVVAVVCFFIVRLGGKKSVSQMTMPQFVMMITVGSLIAHPLAESRSILGTYISVFIFVMIQIILEKIALNSKQAETYIDSEPTVLIKNGVIQVDKMKKERMTIDQLEAELRTLGIKNINELRTCTLEVNGSIGYEKKKGYESLTYNDFVTLMNLNNKANNLQNQNKPKEKSKQNMFDEVRDHHGINADNTTLD